MKAVAHIFTTFVLALGVLAGGTPLLASESTTDFTLSKKMDFLLQISDTTLVLNSNRLTSKAARAAFDYFVFTNFAVEGGYFLLSTPDTGSALLNGLDFSGKWFPFSSGAETTYRADGVTMHTWSSWTTYLLGAYRSRNLNLLKTQIGYNGYGLGAGVNWHLPTFDLMPAGERLFINFEVSHDSLAPVSGEKLGITNFSLGLGVAF